MKAICEGTIDSRKVEGTILDPHLAGKRLVFDVARHLDRAVMADEDSSFKRCRLDYRLRQGLARDHAGKLVVPPMVKAADKLMSAIDEDDPKRVHRAALGFYNARNDEMRKQLDKIARVRTSNSAMLVGVGAYCDDVFCGDNYLSGVLGDLKPWEIALSKALIDRLGIASGDYVLVSRYPTTRIVTAQVREINGASEDVVYLPVGKVIVDNEETSIADLLDGDLDGDSYVIRTVSSRAAKNELRAAFTAFWNDARVLPLDRNVYACSDHVEQLEFPEEIAREKIMQKAAVGPITLDFYALFIYVQNLITAGINTGLDFEDVRRLMTDSLESCFDLKHSNGADPMALHALLTGVKTLPEVEETLTAQGFAMDKIRRVAHLLGGQSVRKLAQENLPFAITQDNLDFNAVQRFINSAPQYKPLEFIAALMVARTLGTALAADLVFFTLKSARTLAELYRDGLFPCLAS